MTLPSILLPGKAAGLTSYFSPLYLVLFLPAVLIVYSILPQKGRRWWLLAASYAFFWLISGGLAVYLLASTAVMYWVGKRLTAIQQEQKAQVKLAESAEAGVPEAAAEGGPGGHPAPYRRAAGAEILRFLRR